MIAGYLARPGSTRPAAVEEPLRCRAPAVRVTDSKARLGRGHDPLGCHSTIELVPDRMVLSRGVLGGRSMYYAYNERRAVAASRLATVVDALDGRPRIDEQALLDAVVFGSIPAGRTLYRGIARVKNRQRVTLELGGTAHATTIPLPVIVEDTRSAEALAELLWDVLLATVDRCSEGARTVAVLAGGGLDSSGLLAAAVATSRGASPRDVINVCMSFAAEGDDRPYHRDLVRALGIVPIRLDPTETAPELPEDFAWDGWPYLMPSMPLDFAMHRAAVEHGATTVLTGAGGDRLLAGDMRYLAHVGDRGLGRSIRDALRIKVPWDASATDRVMSFIVRPWVKRRLPSWLTARILYRELLRDADWLGPVGRERLRATAEERARHRLAPRTAEERYHDSVDDEEWSDLSDLRTQLEAATGCEREDPYMTEPLVRLLSSIPPAVMCDGDWHRGLFRRALRGRVPDSIRFRNDKSFFEPALAAMTRTPGTQRMIRDLMDAEALHRLGIVDAARFRRAAQALLAAPERAVALWCPVWQTLAAEAFARRHG
jgi:asparagine synthase (glutamine-hydrolysing)